MDGKLVVATADEQEHASLTVNGERVTGKMTSYLIAGEDLQGEYWGAVFLLPISLLGRALGCPLTVGHSLRATLFATASYRAMHSKRRGNW